MLFLLSILKSISVDTWLASVPLLYGIFKLVYQQKWFTKRRADAIKGCPLNPSMECLVYLIDESVQLFSYVGGIIRNLAYIFIAVAIKFIF